MQELLEKARRVLEHDVSLGKADVALTAFSQRCYGLIASKVTWVTLSLPLCTLL